MSQPLPLQALRVPRVGVLAGARRAAGLAGEARATALAVQSRALEDQVSTEEPYIKRWKSRIGGLR